MDVRPWLRGGWAMDFFLGEVTRVHDDIDWFVWVGEARSLRVGLERRGWSAQPGPPLDQQIDLVRDELESSFALLDEDDAGDIIVGGGPWAGEPWPEARCDDRPGRIGSLKCPIVNPRGQIRIKQMMPVWVPGRPGRIKDAEDIARLETALRANKEAD